MISALLHLFKKKRFYFSLTLAGLLWVSYSFLELRESDHQILNSLAEKAPNVPAEVHYLKAKDRKLRYLLVGEAKSALIVFIHGAPSSLNFWNAFLSDPALLEKASLMAIDRPGYGYSGFGRAETSVEQQAAYLARMLRPMRKKFGQIILHGSSYGGTVAARLAMDYPELADGLLLQSSSMIAGEEKTYGITYPTSHWTLKWLIPSTLRVANEEKLSHFDELTSMEEHWDNITAATFIFHGLADGLIYPENAHLAALRLKHAPFLFKKMFPGRGHDLMWTERAQLKEALFLLLDVLQAMPAISGDAGTSQLVSTLHE